MKLLSAAAWLSIAQAAFAQAPANPPCWHAEFDAFSFLPGEWLVRAEHRRGDGTWETTDARCWISREMKGCVLTERYVGTHAGERAEARGMYGFDSVTGKLQHLWVDDAHGMLTTYEGGRVEDEIVLEYAMVLRGKATVLRDVYTGIEKDAFRIEGSRSNDGGKTWDVTSRLSFTRAPVVETPPLPSVDLPAELARVLTDYEQAWQNMDEEALANLFTEDGFVLSSGGPPVRGRDAIKLHYKDAGGALSLRALAWSTQNDAGYIIGAYARAKGETDVGKFTLTLRKEKNGRWLIVSDMDNSNRR